MFNYIKRELQSVFKRKKTLIIAIVIVVVCLLANLAVKAFTLVYGDDRDGVLGSNVLAFAAWVFWIPYYACIAFADTAFGSYPNPFIKDNVTKNMSRGKIYFGKLITACVLSLAYMILAFASLMATTRIFHSDIEAYNVSLFVENMLIATPLWIAGIAMGIMYLFMFEDKKKAYIAYFITTILIPRIIMLLSIDQIALKPFMAVKKILITQSFGVIPSPANPARNVTFIVAEGFIYAIIATIIGLICYNKKNFDSNKSASSEE